MSSNAQFSPPVAAATPVVFPASSAATEPLSSEPLSSEPLSSQSATCENRRTESWGRTLIWDVPFDLVTLRQAVDQIGALIEYGQPSYVITANLNYVMLHHQQASLRTVTEQADLVLADGQPIVWRSKLSAQPLPERVAGSEMIFQLAQRASQEGWSIYFLGGEQGVAAACADELVRLYPGLQIAGVESPPFRELTDQEQVAQDERIRSSGAQILLVAFGQPKGECWIHEHYQRLGVPVSIQLGASFDFVAGTAHRAPAIWRRLGLEWAYRMCSDPKRLVPRYASNACFLVKALINDWVRKVASWGIEI